jgi:hypothetical protein
MKIKALVSASSGYKQFMQQTKKAVPDLKHDLGLEIEKIVSCSFMT